MGYAPTPRDSRPITLPSLREAVPEYKSTSRRENLSNFSRHAQPTSHHPYPPRQPSVAPAPVAPSRHSLDPSPLIAHRDHYATRDQLASREFLASGDRVATMGRSATSASSVSSGETVRPYFSDAKHHMPNEHDARSEVQLPILSGPPGRSRHSTSSASSGFSDARISLASSSTCTSVSGANRESPNLPQLHGIRTPEKPTVSSRNSPEQHTLPSLFQSDSRTQMPHYQPVRPLSSAVRTPPESYQQPIDRRYNLAPIEYSPSQNYHDRRTRYNEDPHADYQYSRGDRARNYPMSFQNTEVGEQRHKRRRGNLPKHVTDRLRQWFFDHISHPYPSEDEKQDLMAATGLTMNQISNWFINARRRNLPAMNKQAEAEAELRNKQKGLPRPMPTPESKSNRVN